MAKPGGVESGVERCPRTDAKIIARGVGPLRRQGPPLVGVIDQPEINITEEKMKVEKRAEREAKAFIKKVFGK